MMRRLVIVMTTVVVAIGVTSCRAADSNGEGSAAAVRSEVSEESTPAIWPRGGFGTVSYVADTAAAAERTYWGLVCVRLGVRGAALLERSTGRLLQSSVFTGPYPGDAVCDPETPAVEEPQGVERPSRASRRSGTRLPTDGPVAYVEGTIAGSVDRARSAVLAFWSARCWRSEPTGDVQLFWRSTQGRDKVDSFTSLPVDAQCASQ